MIDIFPGNGWYIFTNAVDVFHGPFDGTGLQLTSGQPYVIHGESEVEVLQKVFSDIVYTEDGNIDFNLSIPLNTATIISNSLT